MPVNYQSATFVARYLGVSTGSLHNWATNTPDGFPKADCEIYGIGSKVTARGWLPEHLPLLREWYARRLDLTKPEDAAAHWLLVDAAMTRTKRKSLTRVPPGQIALDIPPIAEDAVA